MSTIRQLSDRHYQYEFKKWGKFIANKPVDAPNAKEFSQVGRSVRVYQILHSMTIPIFIRKEILDVRIGKAKGITVSTRNSSGTVEKI